MDEKNGMIDGFAFADSLDYREAEKEAEALKYIKANSDLSNIEQMTKLYQMLLERKTLKTVVGFSFLKELRDKILKEGQLEESSLPGILIEKSPKELKVLSGSPKDLEKKHQERVDNYRIKLRNSRIISIFLTGIIIVMLVMAIFSDRTKYADYEKKILNKYSAWEEDLAAREKALQK